MPTEARHGRVPTLISDDKVLLFSLVGNRYFRIERWSIALIVHHLYISWISMGKTTTITIQFDML